MLAGRVPDDFGHSLSQQILGVPGPMPSPSLLRVSGTRRVVREHLAAVGEIGLRGEAVQVAESPAGLWVTLADEGETVPIFVPVGLIAETDELRPGFIIEATASLKQMASGSEWYLAASDRVRVTDEVGPIAAQRILGIEQLENEGVLPRRPYCEFEFTKPRAAGLPADIANVVVLAAEDCSSWDDFNSQILGYRCPELVEARWIRPQGEELVEDLIHQLGQIGPKETDVVFLLYGGSSWSDLRVFNDLRVARAIASSKAGVATAIGQANDVTLADSVAMWSFITPSVAGEALERALWRQECNRAVTRAGSKENR